MQLFTCTNCTNLVYFENTACESCGFQLGYDPSSDQMFASQSDEKRHTDLRFCENAQYGACNWLVPANSSNPFCLSCQHNRTIPDLSVEMNLSHWKKFELAKHHLFYSLLRLRLPLETRLEDPASGLAFDILADDPGSPVMTGHDNGVITINLAEADDATREQRRTEFGEPYRTLLGHFRHEIGHYYWDRLVRDADQLGPFRDCFGDESRDYGEALQTYYANGAPSDWREHFVSTYASSHPWEDFAETWAHYLHIVDTLEMAGSFGMRVNPLVTEDQAHAANVNFNPHAARSIDRLIRHWLPIAAAVNSLNRCMGQPDLYPFILTPPVIHKLGFVHDLVHRSDPAKKTSEPGTQSGDLRYASE